MYDFDNKTPIKIIFLINLGVNLTALLESCWVDRL